MVQSHATQLQSRALTGFGFQCSKKYVPGCAPAQTIKNRYLIGRVNKLVYSLNYNQGRESKILIGLGPNGLTSL